MPPAKPIWPAISSTGWSAYYSGIVVLGRLDGTAAQRISAMNGSVTATIEASDE